MHTRSYHVSESDTERNGEIEKGKNSGSNILYKEIGDECRRNGRVRSLADANLKQRRGKLYEETIFEN